MIKPPQEFFDQFYAPFVGSQQHCDELREDLSTCVNDIEGDFFATDPYKRLRDGVVGDIQHVSRQIPAKKFRDRLRRSGIETNGVLGADLTIAALRTLGSIYHNQAEVPQKLAKVTQNTQRTLGYVLSMAFTGKVPGVINLEVGRRGRNPRNPLNAPLIFLGFMYAGLKQDRSFSPKAFRIEQDEAGQLDIRPRHRRVGQILPRQCPATYAKVEVNDRRQSGLWTLMHTIGEVAIAEIFPRQFDIAEANSD